MAQGETGQPRKLLLKFGIVTNLFLLGYYKYSDFFIDNFNLAFGTQFNFLNLVLPLAISFFTFQQIAYLVDSYRHETKEYDFFNYIVFVSFFPQLIAGPIVHHTEVMPQFRDNENKRLNYNNIAIGITIFAIGFFKKAVIADTFAEWANRGFDEAQILTFFESWVTSLSYTIQLYFDFSGYTDMAIGSAYMFNIKLPLNFNSPYKAINIQDFWRRWHMTLSRFLRDYVYIPLGGNKVAHWKIYSNLMITFIVGGLWHGAGWTFVFWGFMHGMGTAIHRAWGKTKIKIHPIIAWFITFNFVNIAWVFFRAKEWGDAIKVLKGMFALNGIILPLPLQGPLNFLTSFGITFGGFFDNIRGTHNTLVYLIITLLIAFLAKNSMELAKKFTPTIPKLIIVFFLMMISLGFNSDYSEFLYFNF